MSGLTTAVPNAPFNDGMPNYLSASFGLLVAADAPPATNFGDRLWAGDRD